jgi:hypothetical protein
LLRLLMQASWMYSLEMLQRGRTGQALQRLAEGACSQRKG